jgi:hypothetical protein
LPKPAYQNLYLGVDPDTPVLVDAAEVAEKAFLMEVSPGSSAMHR